MMRDLAPDAEARDLLQLHGGAAGLVRCIDTISHHFGVLQSRSQLLLTLGTLTLTITGFSGPTIAASGWFSRVFMAIGLVNVLASMLLLLLSSLDIHWITQITATEPLERLTRLIEYRNRKTRLFRLELLLLVIGLACYVAALVAYLLVGIDNVPPPR